MAVDLTTTELIKAIKRRGSIPTSQQLFSTDDMIDLANDEMSTMLVSALMSVREEYFVSYKDFEIPQSSVPYSMEIPADAIGMKIRDLVWVDPTTEVLTNIPLIVLEQASGSIPQFGSISGFIMQNNKVILYPSTNEGTIRMYYPRRPLKLTSVLKSGQVVSINTGTNEVVLTTLPSTWGIGTVINAVGQSQPFATSVISATITAVSSPTIVLSSVTGLSVGDWVSVEGYSVIPQIPLEAHMVLAQATAAKCLEAMGDSKGMENATNRLTLDLKEMMTLIAPRVEGQSKKITTAGNGIFDNTRSNRRGY